MINIFHVIMDNNRIRTLEYNVAALMHDDRIAHFVNVLYGLGSLALCALAIEQALEIEQLKGDLKRHQMEGAR